MHREKIHHLADTIFQRLLNSQTFEEYRSAFRSATTLPLRFVHADPNAWSLNKHQDNQSLFCETLNEGSSSCTTCLKVNQKIMHKSALDGSSSRTCFAGLSATAISVSAGKMLIGYLKTGQVFQTPPTEEDFQEALSSIQHKEFSEKEIQELRGAYFQTSIIEPARYKSMITLLNHFAKELSSQAEKLAISLNEGESEPIRRARDYIHDHLDESISLPATSAIAGMSESHFCRQFKLATGMTLTEYVNYARILWAKKELLKSNARVSEVAFMVGFQSLSQFNRCFAKFHGGSPSQYRDEVASLPANKS